MRLSKDNCPYEPRLCGFGAQCKLCDEQVKPIKHIVRINHYHQWEKNSTGEVDDVAWDNDGSYQFLHGPRCTRCGAYFAINLLTPEQAEKELDKEWDCVVEEKLCPWCNHVLKVIETDWTNCPYCGRLIDVNRWEEFEIREDDENEKV